MLAAAAVAAALAAGAHPLLVFVAAVAVLRPWLFLAGVAGWSIFNGLRHRRRLSPAAAEAVTLEAVAAEVRGGATLRGAIAAAADGSDLDLEVAARLAVSGRPMAEVATELERRLPVNGAVVAPAVTLASVTGSSVGPLFDFLALRAGDVADEERERRTATAQARLSAWLVGGAPAVFAILNLAFGDRELLTGPTGLVIAAAGFGLQALGGIVVWRMVRGTVG